MADAADSKSVGATHVGSSPTFGTSTARTALTSHTSGGCVTTPNIEGVESVEDTTFGGWRACDVCGEPIARIDEAVLALRAQALAERRAAVLEAAQASTEGAPGRAPGLVAWDWGHAECLGAMELTYVIAGPRFDTMPKLVARTLQLLDEPWFLETAWEDAARRFYRIPFE